MKSYRRVFLIVLSFLFLAPLIACSPAVTQPENQAMTKGQWIQMLADGFCMDNYVESTPYYSDVPASSEMFTAVQACCEWDVLDKQDARFEPNATANRGFVISSAARATGGVDIEAGDLWARSLAYASSKGVLLDMSEEHLAEGVTETEGAAILEWAIDDCLNQEFVEVENVTYADGVQDLTEDLVMTTEDGFALPASEAEGLGVGDIVLLPPTEDAPEGTVQKITAIKEEAGEDGQGEDGQGEDGQGEDGQGEDGQGEHGEGEDGQVKFITVPVGFEEAIKELEVAKVVVPEASDFVLAEGVTMSGGARSASYAYAGEPVLQNATGAPSQMEANTLGKGANFTFDWNFTKGKASLSAAWENLSLALTETYSPSPGLGEWFSKSTVIPDKNLFGEDPYNVDPYIESYKNGDMSLSELKNKLKAVEKRDQVMATAKYDGGYEITGSVSITDFYFKPKVVYEWGEGFKEISFESNINISTSLSVKGEIGGELSVGSVPVPLGPTGLVLDVDLFLYVDLNGEIKVEASVSNNTKLQYKNGRWSSPSRKESQAKAEAALSVEAGIGCGATLTFCKVFKAFDVELKCGALLEASAEASYTATFQETADTITLTRRTEFKGGTKLYVPIITFSLGYDSNTLANKLGIKFKCKIVDKEKAFKIDIIPEKIIWEKERVDVLANRAEEEPPDDGSDGVKIGETLLIDAFAVTLNEGESKKISVTTLPKDYALSDVVFQSADGSIAGVSANGTVTAKKSGVTSVTAATKDGKFSVTCAVMVSAKSADFTPLR